MDGSLDDRRRIMMIWTWTIDDTELDTLYIWFFRLYVRLWG